MLVLDVVVWHGKCLCHVKKYLSEVLTERESPDIVFGVTVAEADGFRLCGRNHKLIFEQNKFSHARKQVCGYTKKTCHIIIFEYVNMTPT
jgi:hypothetical protein